MPTPITRTTNSEAETRALGAGVADLLKPGDVLTLRGDLGAGKTTFLRGLVEHLGVDPALVSSPTYVIVNEYPCPDGQPIPGVIHVDAYRLTGGDDLEAAGWDRLFDHGRPTGQRIALIEWPDRIADILTEAETAGVEISHAGATRRTFGLTFPRSWSARGGIDLFESRPPVICPVTGRWVSPTCPTYPFVNAKARDADLYKWIVPTDESSEDDSGA
ncbi:MAG: tRNA (adenosine(37)-N6)-threonylcarbamoyltransferase complex ATPase subunit type 1 TsaE [Phycisphaeraceae bacterium]|nr:tRNA (adenosine(37)-N6)-threonylcarbamoyltransferase complex ATPase subunit type 1 TsaE [Phycisphaeraceae bacterium]